MHFVYQQQQIRPFALFLLHLARVCVQVIGCMDLLHGTEKTHLLITTFQASDTVEAQNIMTNTLLNLLQLSH